MKTARALAVQVHGVDLRAMLLDGDARVTEVGNFRQRRTVKVRSGKREKREEKRDSALGTSPAPVRL